MEFQTDGIDAVSLVSRGWVTLALEDMAEMTPAIRTDNLGSLHTEGAIGVSGHGTRQAVEIRRPPTSRLELVVGLVQRGSTPGACVHAFGWLVLVVRAGEGRLGAFFA